MKNNIDNFVEEITTNFSELFVETFFLRYLSEFDKNELLQTTKEAELMLKKKIAKEMKTKLKSIGYSDSMLSEKN